MLLDDAPEQPGSPVPDISEILHMLKRHKLLLAKLMVTFVAVGFFIVLMIPSKYRAVATLVLNDQTVNTSDFQSIMTSTKLDTMSVKTEAQIIESPALAEQTIAEVNLIKQPEYDWAENNRDAINVFLDNLYVYTQNTSRAMELSFISKNPELAATVANAHAANYLEAQAALKQQQMEKLGKLYEAKVAGLKADAIRKAQAVQDFRAREALTLGKDNKELIYQQISDVAGQLVPVEVSKYNYESKSPDRENSSTSDPAAMNDVVNSLLIQDLKKQASTAAQQLGAMQAQYGPRHPKVIEASGQLAQINAAIARETQMIVNSMRQGKESTEAQETLLKSRLTNLNKEADGLRGKMVTLESLQLEADASRKILDNFLANYETVQSQAAFAWPDATLVSAAIVPSKPVAPGKRMLMLVVLVVSACLSLGIVFGMELMRSGVKNFADIRKLAQKPLGIIPLTNNPLMAIRSNTQSSYKEAMKRIYMAALMNSKAHSILVTSAMPKEGRTSFALSMASYIRSLDHSVLVIDADFLRPSLSQFTSNPLGPGLADVLAEKASLTKALDTGKEGVAVLRAGSKALYSPDLLKSGHFTQLMKGLRLTYEYILVDSGPMLAHSEAGAIAAQVDGIIIVAEWLKTSQKTLSNLLAALSHVKTPILGIVMNKVDIDKYKAMSTGSDFLLPKAANAA